MVAELAGPRVEAAPLRLGARARAVPAVGFSLAAVAALGAAGGGYFPASWGWSGLAFAWVAGLALAFRPIVRLRRSELIFLGGLAALLAWIAVSVLWSESATPPVREAERTAVYVLAVFAAVLVTRARFYRGLLGGVWAAISVVSLYALGTKLVPDRFGEFNSLDDYRLSEPVGYWNALGILAAIGALLALGMVARSRNLSIAALAAASTVVLLPTLYLTLSRGAWLALAVGFAVFVVLDPKRLQLLTAALLLAPTLGLAVYFASEADALIVRGSAFEDAMREGHRLVAILALLVPLAAVSALALRIAEKRIRVPRPARLAYGAALTLAGVSLVVGAVVKYGGPVSLAERGYDSFVSPLPPESAANPRARLRTLASPGRADHWRVAWDVSREHPLLGSGAGSYERSWAKDRPNGGIARDAHSLYLEILAELGPLGLALLLGALAVPLVVAVKARRRALVPAAAAAYAAYLVHAGVDWDWEMPVVTVAALLCGVGILAAGRSDRTKPLSTRARYGLLAVTLALGGFAFVGLMGNYALAQSRNAVEDGNLARAESQARRAIRWAPWSTEPWHALAKVHFERNDLPQARAALLEAIAKDKGDWALWYDLGVAGKGAAQQHAYEEAARLNPRARNVNVLRILGVLPKLPAERR